MNLTHVAVSSPCLDKQEIEVCVLHIESMELE